MKFLVLALLLVGCTRTVNVCDTEKLYKIARETECSQGILYTIQAFQKQLKGKVKKDEFDALWKRCDRP